MLTHHELIGLSRRRFIETIHFALPVSTFQSSVLKGATGKPSLLKRFDLAVLLNANRTATGL
jgi:hypothetical protein